MSDELEDAIRALRSELQDLRRERASSRPAGRLSQLERRLDALRAETAAIDQRIALLEPEVRALREKVAELRAVGVHLAKKPVDGDSRTKVRRGAAD